MIVPVYNPGRDIDDCIRSLLDQSLPTDEYEVIFVDDGSTDETPARLDELADAHPNITTLHIPNSGWPGRPRNVGMDAASGEFLLFVDNDDWLGREALERLYARALTDDADIVVGKVVGRGKKVPRGVFRRDRRNLSIRNGTAPLALLSPHKLFRASMLRENDVRFPEGPRRLEDHAFVVHAYFHARRTSILADYPCYYWVLREDRANASARRWDPAGYYENVREALDIVDEHTEPGELRDRLKLHWYRGKMLQRVGGRSFLRRDPDWSREIWEQVRRLALERFGPDAAAGLAFNLRLRSHLLRDGTWESMRSLAAYERQIRARVVADGIEGRGDGLLIGLRASLRGPLAVSRTDGRILWDAPEELAGAVDEELLDVSDEIGTGRVQLVLVSADDEREYLVRSRSAVELVDRGHGSLRPLVSGRARLRPQTAAAGSALPPGTWTLRAVVIVLGFAVERKVVRPDGTSVELVSTPGGKLRDALGGDAVDDRVPVGPRARATARVHRLSHALGEEAHSLLHRAARTLQRRSPRVAAAARRLLFRPSVTACRTRPRPAARPPGPADRLLEKPVFVISSVRSGSTLLRVLLGSHSQICAPPELHLRHIAAQIDEGYPERALAEVGLGPDDLTFLLWDRLLHRELVRRGKRVLVNKTPNDVFILDRILECWPDARLLFLLRHPAEIARSRQAVRKQDSPAKNLRRVLRYCDAVETARQNHPGLTIRYEDLTTDPEGVTREICEWLGVPWEPAMLSYRDHDHGRFRPGLGDWSGNIKSGTIQPAAPPPPVDEIPKALLPLAKAWGYLPGESETRRAAEIARESS